MRLEYELSIDGEGGGKGELEIKPGVNQLRLTVQGKIQKAQAVMELRIEPGEKIFMNGYQTWTYCPEYTAEDKIRPWGYLPKAAVRHFGLDRYGDYHFVEYPNKKGITHGVSYCYFRKGESYRLLASLDERPGYTLFKYDAGQGKLYIERDCKGLEHRGEYPVLGLYYGQGTEQEVFDGWFKAMGIKPRTAEKIKGYSSWYNRYEDISQDSIMADLEGCAGALEPGDLFQIDDGWEKAVGDWAVDEKKFPQGLKAIADEIHGRGLKSGLWLAPFGAAKNSELVKLHPDWLLKVNGEPWYCGCNWGGFYGLDIDNGEAVEYLRQVFDTVLNQWGFDLVKLDFLYAAAPFGNERETRAGRMVRAMELLRELCGGKLILGCGVPLMPAFGLVDYCRVSCDVSLDWDNSWIMRQAHRERVSTRQAIGNSIFRRQLNGRAFISDPDVFFLREDNVKLGAEEKRKLALVCSLFGGVLLCSDNVAEYSAEARALYGQMLENRNAEYVRVENDGALVVRYRVDGEDKYEVIVKSE
jgi:alpha-galactosidase